jgi:hypothetical protein
MADSRHWSCTESVFSHGQAQLRQPAGGRPATLHRLLHRPELQLQPAVDRRGRHPHERGRQHLRHAADPGTLPDPHARAGGGREPDRCCSASSWTAGKRWTPWCARQWPRAGTPALHPRAATSFTATASRARRAYPGSVVSGKWPIWTRRPPRHDHLRLDRGFSSPSKKRGAGILLAWRRHRLLNPPRSPFSKGGSATACRARVFDTCIRHSSRRHSRCHPLKPPVPEANTTARATEGTRHIEAAEAIGGGARMLRDFGQAGDCARDALETWPQSGIPDSPGVLMAGPGRPWVDDQITGYFPECEIHPLRAAGISLRLFHIRRPRCCPTA